jgi:hypothetical protein
MVPNGSDRFFIYDARYDEVSAGTMITSDLDLGITVDVVIFIVPDGTCRYRR